MDFTTTAHAQHMNPLTETSMIDLQVVIASLRFHLQKRIQRKLPKHGVNALVEPGAHGSEASVVTTSPYLAPKTKTTPMQPKVMYILSRI